MSDYPIGSIVSADITVDDANGLRDFYSQVVGWKVDNMDMGDYSDYMMKSPKTDQPVAGVCHKQGSNADLPGHWIVYVNVENMETSLRKCTELGGNIVKRNPGFALIRDPSGAMLGLVQI